MKNNNEHKKIIAGSIAVVGLSIAVVVLAITSVGLGGANDFTILAGSGITNTGSTSIVGDVGTYPTLSETGFGSITLTGTNHGGDSITQLAKTDLVTAYATVLSETPTGIIVADLGGQTLVSGVYKDNGAPASLAIAGGTTLTLDGGGNPDAIFIFQSASTLITGSDSQVLLINEAQACNVFWQVGSSATLGTNSNFQGTLMAQTSITATTGATVQGRLLAMEGAVTLDTNTITKTNCTSTVGDDTATVSDKKTSRVIGGCAAPWSFVNGSCRSAFLENPVITIPNEVVPKFPKTGLPPRKASRMIIPSINVDASIEPVGITPSGQMGSPQGIMSTGWYDQGPRPGELGSAVIDGHSGWSGDNAAVFDRLPEMHKGDRVYISDEKGLVYTFIVRNILSYDPQSISDDVFISDDGKAHLNLITCTGAWDEALQTHAARLVVFTDREV